MEKKLNWKPMACPDNKGRHPVHDYRYITEVIGDPEIEYGHDERSGNWSLVNGRILCKMRDIVDQKEVATLIAAAPELLAACKELLEALDNLAEKNSRDKCWNGMDTDKNGYCVCTHCKANRAIAKAEGK